MYKPIDDSRFGQKLMEKMGWSKGRGLGANEDGKKQSIAVSLKNNTRGVGWSKKTEDNWIAHQDDFTALLSTLNENHGSGSSLSDEVVPMSLEQTSRSSRGRVHYQKFTKGKDLSLRSKTDLNCVFGKRKLGANEPMSQLLLNEVKPVIETSPCVETNLEDCGLKTVTSSDSVQDYFAKKMAALKSKRAIGTGVNDTGDCNSNDSVKEDVNADCDKTDSEVKKPKKKKRKTEDKRCVEDNDDYKEPVDIKLEDEVKLEKEESKGKKKKRKREEKDLKVTFSLGENELDNSCGQVEETFMQNEPQMKNKKRKIAKKDLRVRFDLGENDSDKSDEIKSEEDRIELETEGCNVAVESETSENVASEPEDKSLTKKKKKKGKKSKNSIVEEVEVKIEQDVRVDGKLDTVKLETMEDEVSHNTKEIVTVETHETVITAETSVKKKKGKKCRKNKFKPENVEKVEDEIIESTENPIENISNDKIKHENTDSLDEEIPVKNIKMEETEAISDQQDDTKDEENEQRDEQKDLSKKNKKSKLKIKHEETLLLKYATAVKEEISFIMKTQGAGHKPVFNMHVTIGSRNFGTVKCQSKNAARQEASILALNELRNEGELMRFEGKSAKQGKSANKGSGRRDNQISKDGIFVNCSLDSIPGYPGLPVPANNYQRNSFNGEQNMFHSPSRNPPKFQGRTEVSPLPPQNKHIKF